MRNVVNVTVYEVIQLLRAFALFKETVEAQVHLFVFLFQHYFVTRVLFLLVASETKSPDGKCNRYFKTKTLRK